MVHVPLLFLLLFSHFGFIWERTFIAITCTFFFLTGVSAVPMAARVSNTVGQKNNPSNFLLMHAMGPNVAGVIGSAIAAGFLLSVFG